MSWTLGIDTTSTELGIGLVHEQSAVCGHSRYIPNSHAEHIPAIVDFVLRSNGIAPGDIRQAGIAVGPGSFTGLRIGIAFLKGLFFGRETKVLPISSMESVAGAWGGTSDEVVVAFDARQDQVFHARFSCSGNHRRRVTEDLLSDVDTLNRRLTGEETVLTDSLGNRRSTVWERLTGAGSLRHSEAFPLQRGLSCALIASRTPADDSRWVLPADVLPQYLQPSRAESRRK